MINHRGEYDATCGAQLVQTALLSHVYAALAKVPALRFSVEVRIMTLDSPVTCV